MDVFTRAAAGIRRSRVLRVCLAAACVLALLFFLFTRDFSGMVGISSPAQISRVEVQAGSGRHKTITSRQEINQIFSVVNGARYLRFFAPPLFTGYAYMLVFYDDDKEIGRILLGAYPQINTVSYISFGTIDTGRLKRITGI